MQSTLSLQEFISCPIYAGFKYHISVQICKVIRRKNGNISQIAIIIIIVIIIIIINIILYDLKYHLPK